jgi:hypothetical protein
MRTQTSKTKKKPAALDKLIKTEWDILKDLKKMLKNPELSPGEKSRVANALAYHASVLNKLLTQKGEEPRFNELTLGDYVKNIRIQTRAARIMIRSFKFWTKKASSKK